jgi:hypothetical protein
MEPRHSLLASAGGGLDQSTATGKRHRSSYVDGGRLIGGRGVIFPGSYRFVVGNPSRQQLNVALGE